MKKIFLATALFMSVASAFAQKLNTVVYVDANGKEVPDGSTITYSELEDDGFGSLQVATGLSVKNVSDGIQQVRSVMEIKEIPNGSAQVCTFTTCKSVTTPGVSYSPIDKDGVVQAGPIKAGDVKPLMAEWFPVEGKYGAFVATYRLEIYKYEKGKGYTKIGDGPSVTVNQVYADPTGIAGVENSADVKSLDFFDLSGRKVSKPQHGLYVKRTTMSDGTVKTVKQVVK